ncbi:MAG: peptidylprolyl isomerase [Pirellulales bacterium]|nr:peptidylprolyl isomerase [Pirellulales bacterium]
MRRALDPRRAWAWMLILLVAVGCGGQADTPTEEPDRDWAGSIGGASKSGKPGADTTKPVVEIATSLGKIVLRLDGEKAPLTVDNFLHYVDQKHYDGTIFHDVAPGYAVVGGSYNPDLTEKPVGVAIRNEAHNGLTNVRGTIAMARGADIDSATCQFFINLADNAKLDHKDATPEGYGYCVFGQVIEGQDVLDKLASAPVHKVTAPNGAALDRVPVEPLVIQSIRRVP